MTLAGGLSDEATFADRGGWLLAGVWVCFPVLGLPDCFLACKAARAVLRLLLVHRHLVHILVG